MPLTIAYCDRCGHMIKPGEQQSALMENGLMVCKECAPRVSSVAAHPNTKTPRPGAGAKRRSPTGTHAVHSRSQRRRVPLDPRLVLAVSVAVGVAVGTAVVLASTGGEPAGRDAPVAGTSTAVPVAYAAPVQVGDDTTPAPRAGVWDSSTDTMRNVAPSPRPETAIAETEAEAARPSAVEVERAGGETGIALPSAPGGGQHQDEGGDADQRVSSPPEPSSPPARVEVAGEPPTEDAGAVAVAVGAKASDRGLISHWAFEDEDATVSADSWSRGNHGEVHGGAAKVPGRFGTALRFDGKDDFVSIPNESDYDLATSVSMCAWIKGRSSMGPWRGAVTKHDNMNLQRFNRTKKMVWQTKGTSQCQLTSASDVLDGEWHHVVGTYDGEQKRIYVDGELEGTAACTGAIDTADSPVEIGRNGYWDSYHWKGEIDEVRIYGRALDPKEVKILYETGALPESDAIGTDATSGDADLVATDSPNLVPNGGFEERDDDAEFATRWHRYCWGTRGNGYSSRLDKSDAHSGGVALAVRCHGEGQRPGAFTVIPVVRPGTYVVSFWACAEVDATAHVQAHFAGHDMKARPVGDEWMCVREKVQIEGRAPNHSIKVWTTTPGVRVWFDDVEVREVE